MFRLLFATVLIVAAIAGMIAGKKANARWSSAVGIGVIVVAFVLGATSAFTTVPTKDIGVKTAFGRPTGYLTNGIHLKAPWEKVTLMDGAIQTDTHNRGAKDSDCIRVRISHQIVACADTNIGWQLKESSVDTLFQNYRGFDNIRDNLVDKNLQTILNKTFENYDPLAVDENGNASAPQLSDLSKQALTQMRVAVGDKITVSTLNVTVLNYDDATQAKINSLQAQVAQTRIAQQAIKTAQQQATANKTLADSVSKSPNVLVSQCFDIVNNAVDRGRSLPAGFTCWPGENSAVVVPAAK